MRRRTPNAGLTLLEVILAITLVILLVGAVYAFQYNILSRRDHNQRQNEAIFARRRVMDLMAAEVQSTLFYPMLQMGVEGTEERINFMRAVIPSNAVFLEQSTATGTAIGDLWQYGEEEESETAAFDPQHDVQLVGYRLYRYEDEEGVEQVGGLERTCQRTLQAQTSEEGENIEVSLLTEHVKFLNIEYYDGTQWVGSWQGEDLPVAIRISIGTQPLEEGASPEEYPYETTSRVVALASADPAGEGPGRSGRPGRVGDVFDGVDGSRRRGDVFQGGDVFEGGDVFRGSRRRGTGR